MDASYSLKSLTTFLDTLGKKGLVKPATVQSLKVACGKILVDLSDAEENDVRKVDVALAVRKFNNKHPGVLSPQTLAEYQRRVSLVVREFEQYLGDPAGYRGFGRGPGKQDNGEKPTRGRKEPGEPGVPRSGELQASNSPAPTTGGLTFSFPLRQDFLAQLVVPRDMKNDEAQRLCTFIRALAIDATTTP